MLSVVARFLSAVLVALPLMVVGYAACMAPYEKMPFPEVGDLLGHELLDDAPNGGYAYPRDNYALDGLSRSISGRLACYPEAMVSYQGDVLRYQGSVRIHPAFREHLVRFEQVVNDVAIEVYGRPPARILHAGAFNCRPIRHSEMRLSEHALGNGIDIVGFEFARAAKGTPPPQKKLRKPFEVRVARNWSSAGNDAIHAEFLHRLVGRLASRDDVFRGILGPGFRDHDNHLHLDMGVWRFLRADL